MSGEDSEGRTHGGRDQRLAHVGPHDLGRGEADGLEDADTARSRTDGRCDDVADDEHRHDQAQGAEGDEERNVERGVALGGLPDGEPRLFADGCSRRQGARHGLAPRGDLRGSARVGEAVEHLVAAAAGRGERRHLGGDHPGVRGLRDRAGHADHRQGRTAGQGGEGELRAQFRDEPGVGGQHELAGARGPPPVEQRQRVHVPAWTAPADHGHRPPGAGPVRLRKDRRRTEGPGRSAHSFGVRGRRELSGTCLVRVDLYGQMRAVLPGEGVVERGP